MRAVSFLPTAVMVLHLVFVDTLAAQRLEGTRTAVARARHEPGATHRATLKTHRAGNVGGMIAVGTLGGGVGFLVGGLAGASLAKCTNSGDDLCGLAEGIYGAIVGESALMAVGVHLAGKGRAAMLAQFFAGLCIAAVGVWGVVQADAPWPLVLVPPLQLLAMINLERK